MTEQHSFVVTGANSYLGRALAIQLSKNNDNLVFLTSRTPFDYSDLQKKKNVKYLPDIDLLNEHHLSILKQNIIEFIPGKFNLINSLGYFRAHEPFENTDISEARRMLESHFLTLYGTVYYLLPLMKERKGGHIIAFSCNSVKYRYPYMASFTAAKAAIESFVGTIANEFGGHGINANSIALSSLQTPFVKDSKPNGDYDHYLDLKDVSIMVEDLVKSSFKIMNGNTISMYEYSDTFFNEGYFSRIRTSNK